VSLAGQNAMGLSLGNCFDLPSEHAALFSQVLSTSPSSNFSPGDSIAREDQAGLRLRRFRRDRGAPSTCGGPSHRLSSGRMARMVVRERSTLCKASSWPLVTVQTAVAGLNAPVLRPHYCPVSLKRFTWSGHPGAAARACRATTGPPAGP
jgi:hypothetical protein